MEAIQDQTASRSSALTPLERQQCINTTRLIIDYIIDNFHGLKTIGIIDPNSDIWQKVLSNKSIHSDIVDLKKQIRKKYDLIIACDLTENSNKYYGMALPHTLCQLSGLIFFSAPVPGQHRYADANAHWPSYWIGQFSENKYLFSNEIREHFWLDGRLLCRYRQNSLLFANDQGLSLAKDPGPFLNKKNTLVDVIHPELFINQRRILDNYINPDVPDHSQERTWTKHVVNEEHRLMCEAWLEELASHKAEKIVIFGAGGTLGLGRYLFVRAEELGIEVAGYVEYFDHHKQDTIFEAPLLDFTEATDACLHVDAVLIASPGYKNEIASRLHEVADLSHSLIVGLRD